MKIKQVDGTFWRALFYVPRGPVRLTGPKLCLPTPCPSWSQHWLEEVNPLLHEAGVLQNWKPWKSSKCFEIEDSRIRITSSYSEVKCPRPVSHIRGTCYLGRQNQTCQRSRVIYLTLLFCKIRLLSSPWVSMNIILDARKQWLVACWLHNSSN